MPASCIMKMAFVENLGLGERAPASWFQGFVLSAGHWRYPPPHHVCGYAQMGHLSESIMG